MRLAVLAVLVATACGARPPIDRPAARFAVAVAAGVARGDAHAVGALFAPDARVVLVGDPGDRAGVPGVERAVRAITATFARVRIAIGRIWIDRAGTTAVIELVFAGRRGTRDVAVAGAAVVTFAGAGPEDRATALRLYLDLVTVIGQLDPTRLPARTAIRGLEPPPATGSFAAAGTEGEAANLTIANEVWAGLDAHDADRVMASASADYRYVDYAAPKVLDRAGTHALVAGFVAAVTDFRIADKPVQFAAGDFVVTEMVEQASFAGKPITLHGLDIKRFVAGRVVEEWQYSNYFEILAQLADVALPVLP